MTGPSGTEGYADEAETLVRQYESIAFADVHRAVLALMPSPPADVVDIGAGTGRDAAGLAALGYRVTAVEPTAALRRHAMALHDSPDIAWVDDSLPELSVLSARGETYDIVMLTAVWMHLDHEQRQRAMLRVAALVRPDGVMMLSLRHGPVPAGRRMFEVSPSETIGLAQHHGLQCIQHLPSQDSLLRRPDVTWDRLAFAKRTLGR
ncbi:MAG TPA: class I SAM-dependent methyltransferase [Acetobacteraceae bacterium]|nr:class I SAM-dependent methyltransferase [Acetobacteraceae bacterium]